jgi:hypothetical protein
MHQNLIFRCRWSAKKEPVFEHVVVQQEHQHERPRHHPKSSGIRKCIEMSHFFLWLRLLAALQLILLSWYEFALLASFQRHPKTRCLPLSQQEKTIIEKKNSFFGIFLPNESFFFFFFRTFKFSPKQPPLFCNSFTSANE